jgi:hypothetical protein
MNRKEKSTDDLAKLIWKTLRKRNLPVPQIGTLEAIFQVLFYTSLKTEELEPIRCSVTYLDPKNPDPKPPPRIRHQRWRHYQLGERIGLSVSSLRKFAKAMDPNSVSIAIYADGKGRPFIWGVIDQYPMHSARFIAHESESGPQIPGLFNAVITGIGEIAVWRLYGLIARLEQSSLITKYHDVLRFGPVADRLKICIDQYVSLVKEHSLPEHTRSIEKEWYPFLGDYWRRTVCRLLIAIRNYKNGGALIISPQGDPSGLKLNYVLHYERLHEALVNYSINKIGYHFSQNKILDEYRAKKAAVPYALQSDSARFMHENNDCRAALAGTIALVASLSRVDGLVLLDDALNVCGFGAEILAEKDISKVNIADGPSATTRQIRSRNSQAYGTRHRSMMRYCASHADSLGFVLSHDGDVRAIMNVRGKVVMWENIQLYLNFKS